MPNKSCYPYSIFMYLQKKLGKSDIDLEIPYSRGEFKKYCKQNNKEIIFLGGASNFFGDSKVFIYRLVKLIRVLEKIISGISKKRTRNIQKEMKKGITFKSEKKSSLDKSMGYSLLLIAKNNS